MKTVSRLLLSLCATLAGAFFSFDAFAQNATVKVFGVAFLEAPPGRDKNLTPFGAGSNQEKVEVNAIVSVKDRMMIDIHGMGREQNVSATGMLANKSMLPLGSAEIGSFPKVSADKKHMSLTMSVARLTDTTPVAVSFSGYVNVRVARSQSIKSSSFSTKPGSSVDFGIGAMKVAKVEGNVVSLEGGSGMERIAAMKFVGKDGVSVPGERSSWGRINERYDISYRFGGTIADGKLEATLFDGVETVVVPINVTITRPY